MIQFYIRRCERCEVYGSIAVQDGGNCITGVKFMNWLKDSEEGRQVLMMQVQRGHHMYHVEVKEQIN